MTLHSPIKAAKTQLYAADLIRKEKQNNFNKLGMDERFKSYPFVMETFGGIGKSESKLLNDIAEVLSAKRSYSISESKVHVLRTLSCILQKHNAENILYFMST